ncbi:PIG-L family deacetylase [bacterium]|nr:PIG-L family deacetylase [bacterium]
MRKSLFLVSILLITIIPAHAKIQPATPDAATLQLLMKRLTVIGSALYVGAHPDDENTATLSYLSMGKLVRTAYLALNRGEGGQNLIGSEQGDQLGVIRTQELLAARGIDYAGQFFTRAIDFGFSKSPEESLRIWGKDEVLSDFVWVFRKFRPDVIILRFPSSGSGHGHHIASAILAEEAFSAAADPSRFPEQLRYTKPWKAKRIVWNSYSWGRDQISDQEKATLSKMELGDYNPVLGKSYTELAGVSRSMHKSQGFGDSQDRGRITEYFKHVAGEPAGQDLFDGIDLTWNRIPGGKEVSSVLDQAVKSFQPNNPSASIPTLLEAYASMKKIPKNDDVDEKMDEVAEVIRICAGLWLEAIADSSTSVPGGKVKITAAAINRSPFPLQLESIDLNSNISVKNKLEFNTPATQTIELNIPQDAPYSQPYWLREKIGKAMAKVDDQQLIGLADSPPSYSAIFHVSAGQEIFDFKIPVLYRWVDPVLGERYRVFGITPEVSIQIQQPVSVFSDTESKNIFVTVQSNAADVQGNLRLQLPKGWKSNPESIPFQFAKKDESRDFAFLLSCSKDAEAGSAIAEATVGGKVINTGRVLIDYPHISPQMVFPKAEMKLVRVDLKKAGDSIGYVMGSGDQVPEILRQVGYHVTLLSDEQLKEGGFSGHDAIVIGIRAYNTRTVLKSAHSKLMNYVENGGTLVVQYNTLQQLVIDSPGPYPFQIGRDRVSVEEAPVTFDSSHPLLNTPNKITAADFDGWIQERGVNFAEKWDSQYQTPLSSNDPGETAKAGGLLYSRYGKGVFIYTSYSWFRELPAGVPGAIRLFVNLVSAR